MGWSTEYGDRVWLFGEEEELVVVMAGEVVRQDCGMVGMDKAAASKIQKRKCLGLKYVH